MTRKKSLWLRWRLFANKHNNRLLYGMMGLMFSAQLILIYKHLKGERVHCKYMQLYHLYHNFNNEDYDVFTFVLSRVSKKNFLEQSKEPTNSTHTWHREQKAARLKSRALATRSLLNIRTPNHLSFGLILLV